MGTNCAPLCADILLQSYEADFKADLIQKREHVQLGPLISFSALQMAYIIKLSQFRGLYRTYRKEFKITNTTDIVISTAFLDLRLEIDGKGNLLTKLYDKRYEFSVLSTFFHQWHSVSICVQSFHNTAHEISEISVNTQFFCIALDF